jgi:putative acetyltransferase
MMPNAPFRSGTQCEIMAGIKRADVNGGHLPIHQCWQPHIMEAAAASASAGANLPIQAPITGFRDGRHRSISDTQQLGPKAPGSRQRIFMLIRAERPADIDAIHHMTVRAFTGMPYSEGTEAPIVRLLRQSGDLALSLVAEEDGIVIGHVAFSPVRIGSASASWFGLGPLSVEPARQRSGIGKALIGRGLEILRTQGAAGVALIGNPDVYRSSGFIGDGRLTYKDLETRYVQRILFCGPEPEGELHFADAFDRATSEG